MNAITYKKSPNGIYFDIKINPKSSSLAIRGLYNGCVKISVISAPTNGKANTECIEFLSTIFSIPKKHIHIVSGATTQLKKIFLETIHEKDFLNAIHHHLRTLCKTKF